MARMVKCSKFGEEMEGLEKPQGVQRVLPFEILIGENC